MNAVLYIVFAMVSAMKRKCSKPHSVFLHKAIPTRCRKSHLPPLHKAMSTKCWEQGATLNTCAKQFQQNAGSYIHQYVHKVMLTKRR